MCISIYDGFYQGALNRAFSLYGASSWHNVLRAIDYNIGTIILHVFTINCLSEWSSRVNYIITTIYAPGTTWLAVSFLRDSIAINCTIVGVEGSAKAISPLMHHM